MKGQRIDHGVSAFDATRHAGIVAYLARFAAQFSQHGKAAGVLVRDQNRIIAAAFQHQRDRETDFSGTQQNDGFGVRGHDAAPAMRGKGSGLNPMRECCRFVAAKMSNRF